MHPNRWACRSVQEPLLLSSAATPPALLLPWPGLRSAVLELRCSAPGQLQDLETQTRFFFVNSWTGEKEDSAAREARLERELQPDSERELELSCRNAAEPLRQRGHPRQMVAVGILCGRLAHEPWRAFSMLAALQVTGLDGGARKARGAARAALFGERGRRCQGADGRRRRWRYFDRHSAPPAEAGAQEQEHAQAEAHEERGHRQHFDRDLCCPPRQAKNAIAAPRHDGSRLEGSCSAQGSNWRKGGA